MKLRVASGRLCRTSPVSTSPSVAFVVFTVSATSAATCTSVLTCPISSFTLKLVTAVTATSTLLSTVRLKFGASTVTL